MHPIVRQFIETDRIFTDILKEVGDPKQALEVIFPIVSSQMNKGRLSQETYDKIDEAIKIGHYDEEVFLLFISYLIVFYCIHEMREKSESTYRISCGIDVKKYRLEIQAYYHQSCSFYFHFADETLKRDELNLLSLSLMPKNSPRYYKFIANTGQILGVDGRLYLLPKEDLELLEAFSNKSYVPLSSLLTNALFVLDRKLIDQYYQAMINNFLPDMQHDKARILQAISILNGDNESNLSDPGIALIWSYYSSLKAGNVENAKKIFAKVKQKELTMKTFSLFAFLQFHHAFVIGWYEIIEDVLKSKKKDYHYLIDFFIVRYFLVKNKKELAKHYYDQLMKNCLKFRAMERLKFEMQFAFELTAISFFELSQPNDSLLATESSSVIDHAILFPDNVTKGIGRIIGASNTVQEIKKKVKKYADIQRPILIIGETGVGKELVARAIHEVSDRHNSPFLAINCGALTDTLLQSELFGYEAGAFTGAVTAHKGIFEAAEDGVVFLDEFGEMSQKLQVSLLRVLENNELFRVGGTKARAIHCRIIAATNANIEELIEKKAFRDDLYHRLKQFSITLPALRERKEDIPYLIEFFLNGASKTKSQVFSDELILKFQEYHWPGNIRELKNEVDRIKVFCGQKPIIEMEDVDIEWLNSNKRLKHNKEVVPTINLQPITDDDRMHQRIMQKKLTLADKRNLKIKQLFQQYKKLTRGQISEALEVNLLTATKDLQRLCKEGVIVKKTPSLSPRSHYFELV